MHNTIKRLFPIIIFIAMILITQNWWRAELLLNPIETDAISENDVVIYTTSWCAYCRKARVFFRHAGIPYTEYDIEKSSRAYAEYQQISGRGVPVIRIGKNIIQGYDPVAIKAALALLNSQKNNL
jgi:glutaredoxin